MKQLNFYITNKDKIKSFKTDARNYAEKHRSWTKNFREFESRLADIKKIPKKLKIDSIQRAIEYEKSKSIRQEIKESLWYRQLRRKIKR